jgi:hypothetical protein
VKLWMRTDRAAQVHWNFGASFERPGEAEGRWSTIATPWGLCPNLPKAQNAMGNHYVRIGCYKDALGDFDQVASADRNHGSTTAVSGQTDREQECSWFCTHLERHFGVRY